MQSGELLQQQRRNDVGTGGEGLAGLDEGWTEGSHQIRGFFRPGSGVVGILEPAGDPVEADTQEIEADRNQRLPEPSDQTLRGTGVDPTDRCRVVLEQASGLDEVGELLALGLHCFGRFSRGVRLGVVTEHAALHGSRRCFGRGEAGV